MNLPEFIRELMDTEGKDGEFLAHVLDEAQEEITDNLIRAATVTYGQAVGERERRLIETMSDEQQELLIKLDLARSDLERAAIAAAFWQGVRLGAAQVLW